MSDLNYNIAPVNPMAGYMQALQFGAGLGEMRDQRAQAQAQAEAARIAAEQKAEKEKQIGWAYKLVGEDPSSENYANLANMVDPEKGKSVRETFAMLDKERQESLLAEAANVFSAFASGQPEIGIRMLEDRAEAYKNADNKQGIRDTQAMIDLAKTGEKGQQAVQNMLGLTISQMPEGKNAIDAVAKHDENWRANDLHGLNKSKLQAEIDAFDEKKKTGGLEAKDVASLELQLNNTVNTRQTASREAQTAFNNIKNGAEQADGVGDLAIINTFMRLLSPGIVTEQDYSAATKSGGIKDELQTLLMTKPTKGDILTPQLRTKFVTMAQKMVKSAEEQNKKQLEGIENIVKTKGLNHINVFGNPIEETSVTPVQGNQPVKQESTKPVEVIKVRGDR